MEIAASLSWLICINLKPTVFHHQSSIGKVQMLELARLLDLGISEHERQQIVDGGVSPNASGERPIDPGHGNSQG